MDILWFYYSRIFTEDLWRFQLWAVKKWKFISYPLVIELDAILLQGKRITKTEAAHIYFCPSLFASKHLSNMNSTPLVDLLEMHWHRKFRPHSINKAASTSTLLIKCLKVRQEVKCGSWRAKRLELGRRFNVSVYDGRWVSWEIWGIRRKGVGIFTAFPTSFSPLNLSDQIKQPLVDFRGI